MNYKSFTRDELTEYVHSLKREGGKIICWGAGKNAEKCIDNLGIMNQITFFVDRDSNKTSYKNFSVKSPESLKEVGDALVVITVKAYWKVLKDADSSITDNGITVTCYELIDDIKRDLYSLEDIWYYNRMIYPGIKRYRKNLEDDGLSDEEISEKSMEKEQFLCTKTDNTFPLVLPRFVVTLTDKCSLHCEGCWGFMNEFKQPKDANVDDVIRGLKNIFDAIDGCINVQLTGGEPFIYRDINVVIQYLLDEEKCEKIGIITNGTIVPAQDTMELLKNKKMFVEISDYGIIAFRVFYMQSWLDYGRFDEKRNKSTETLMREYEKCEDGMKCKPFDGKKLYGCTRASRMNHIGVDGYDESVDSIVINGDPDLADRIKELFLCESLMACDYCSVMEPGTKVIPAGIQKNNRKSEYVIVARSELQRLKDNQKRNQD